MEQRPGAPPSSPIGDQKTTRTDGHAAEGPSKKITMLMSKFPDSAGEVSVLHSLTIDGFYVKKYRALNDTPCHSCGISFAIWDHTLLPAT